jgi:hypothetical protein
MKSKIRKKIHSALLEMMEENNENQYICDDKYFENPLIKLTDFGFYSINNDGKKDGFLINLINNKLSIAYSHNTNQKIH